MFERFTHSARRVVFFARDQAIASREGTINPNHLLLGLIRLQPELFKGALHSVDAGHLCSELESQCKTLAPCSSAADPSFTNELKRVLRNADDEAASQYMRQTNAWARYRGFVTMNRWIVEPRHLLLGLLRESECTTTRMLVARGMTLEELRRRLIE